MSFQQATFVVARTSGATGSSIASALGAASLALEAKHGRHVGPHLSLVAAPRAEAVEEPVATDVLSTTKVAFFKRKPKYTTNY